MWNFPFFILEKPVIQQLYAAECRWRTQLVARDTSSVRSAHQGRTVSMSFLESTGVPRPRLEDPASYYRMTIFRPVPHFSVSYFTTFQKTKPHSSTTIWCLQTSRHELLACAVLAATKTNILLSLLLLKSNLRMALQKQEL